MLQKIVSSTLNHSLTDLAWVGYIDLVESNFGRLEIKFQMYGLESLDRSRRNGYGKCVCFLSASSMNERWWRVTYRHLPKSNHYNIISQLGDTEMNLGGIELH